MRPLYLFILAIITPIVLLASVVLPLYGGVYGACYLAYMDTKPHPLTDKFFDPLYIFKVYSQLFDYMQSHLGTADVIRFILPVTVTPVAGLFLTIWLTRKLMRGFTHLFHLAAASS